MPYTMMEVSLISDRHRFVTDVPTSQGSRLNDEPGPSQRRVSTMPRIDSLNFDRLWSFLFFSCLLCIYLYLLLLQWLCSMNGSSFFPRLDKSMDPCSAWTSFLIFANLNAADVDQEIQRVRPLLRFLAEFFEPR